MCHFFQTYLNSRYICLRYLTIFEEIHFLNFDKNLNPSCVMEGKKKEKMSLKELKNIYVHDEIIALWKWWFEREKNLSLNVIVYIHFYQQRTFLSQEAMFLFFFPCSWFHIPPLYIHFEFKDTLWHGFLQVW